MMGRNVVEFMAQTGKPAEIRFGYDVFGQRLITKRIPVESIRSVDWSTGQVTAMSGKDMNDWMLWMWFDHNDLVRKEKELKGGWKCAGQENYQIGPSGKKADTEALGMAFIEFLRKAGVEVAPGNGPHSFRKLPVTGSEGIRS
ncbi:MAG: hypothetical protein K0Q55_2457 [Verrucomicrobia bacterium]|jgi:hypothetical protein|nr:hypothetical protein [Verrucomicrobiota bacterium]